MAVAQSTISERVTVASTSFPSATVPLGESDYSLGWRFALRPGNTRSTISCPSSSTGPSRSGSNHMKVQLSMPNVNSV